MQTTLLEAPIASSADLAACRALIRTGSRSFFTASKFLPDRVRDASISLYAFCRVADDAVDNDTTNGGALTWLRQRLDAAYAGHPVAIPADRAFAEVAARYSLPRVLPEALLEGFAWDAAGRRYEDLDGITEYAMRVAGTVGAMMTVLMGVRAPEALARACDLGVAMQFSNIARDVGEDARAGRIYLPLTWMREAGIDPDDWLADPIYTEALGSVVKRLLAVADTLYDRSIAGIARLPLGCRPGILAARALYAEIGREVERRGYDSVSQRAVVSFRRKAHLLARTVRQIVPSQQEDGIPPLDQARFLIDAVVAAPFRPLPPTRTDASWWSLEYRVAWLIDLFERVDQRKGVGAGQL